MKARARIVLVLAVVAALLAASYLLPMTLWASQFVGWVRGLGGWGAVAYGLVYVAGTVLLIPGTLLTAGSGFLYGLVGGVLVVSPASTLGATIAFLLSRSFAREWAHRRISRYRQFEAIDRAVEKHGFKIVFLLRLEPMFISFVLLNYALGLTRVRLRDYVLASWLGMLPATLLYVYLGSSANRIAELAQGRLPAAGPWREALLWGALVATAILVFVLTDIARQALRSALTAEIQSQGGGRT